MAASGIHCMQINLHHCKGASAILARNFARMQAAIAFVQEPWVYKSKIRGLSGCGVLVSSPQEPVPRACLIYTGLDAFPLLELTTRDLVVVKAKYLEKNENKREVVVASAYFPGSGDDPEPPTEVEKLVDYCQRQGGDLVIYPLIIGCDANAHHVVWGSTDINDRGRRLRFSDRYRFRYLKSGLITFRLESKDREQEWGRNPRSTDWASYIEDLKTSMACFPTSYGTREEMELAAEYLRDSIICSFERKCVVKKMGFNGGTKKRRHQRAWDEYHTALDSCKKEVERTRSVSWRSFCEGIERVPEASRLHKVLARDPMAKLSTIKLPNGQYAQDKRKCIKHLMEVNFPDFREGSENSHGIGQGRNREYREHWKLAARVVTPERIDWAISTFKPFKASEGDGSSWGLRPYIVNWLYQMILKPRFLHAVVVWWSRTQLITVKEKLDHLQAMIFRGITGAMRTTPTAALGFMLAEVPLHIAAVKKAALGALKNPTIESKLVWECRSVLDELGLANKLALIWVPGHSGIKGNERVDVLAKIGSETEFIGPEPAVAIMPCLVKGAIERWGQKASTQQEASERSPKTR
ncbi:uncharacterized protein LOC122506327 [Leptopilina heterotoma]|uniref:uncharacterized protein LOC122506327 n=1 Tax=Leptopilina heterotoma TaxID=63436 RepID=UPI001CA7D4FA|nr:uncharacterized protein LOC122506327 [Leptopilina heterotoma]